MRNVLFQLLPWLTNGRGATPTNRKVVIEMQLLKFENNEFGSIRTISIDNQPWFVGKDVAECLGYSNPRKAIIDHIDLEDKCDGVTIRDSIGREQTPMLISESGLYSLIMSSKLPKAKEFKHWVTSEVLPSIRKHGAYLTPDTLGQAIADPDFAIGLLSALKDEQTKNKALQADNDRMKPKEIFSDAVATSKTSILIGDLAKLLKQNGVDTGQKRLFAWMRDNGYLIKRKGADWNSPTQRSMEMGLFEIKETSINHPDGYVKIVKTTKVTGKGQIYFTNLFLDQNRMNQEMEVTA